MFFREEATNLRVDPPTPPPPPGKTCEEIYGQASASRERQTLLRREHEWSEKSPQKKGRFVS